MANHFFSYMDENIKYHKLLNKFKYYIYIHILTQ